MVLTAIVPARVRKPKDKSSAEASVRFAETWIVAALRDRKFFSLRELNEAVAEKLDELNSRPFKQMAVCRRSSYLEEEKPYRGRGVDKGESKKPPGSGIARNRAAKNGHTCPIVFRFLNL